VQHSRLMTVAVIDQAGCDNYIKSMIINSPLKKSVPSMSSVVLFASAAIAVTRQLIGELALGTVALQREVSVIRMLLLEAKIRC